MRLSGFTWSSLCEQGATVSLIPRRLIRPGMNLLHQFAIKFDGKRNQALRLIKLALIAAGHAALAALPSDPVYRLASSDP